MSATEIGLRVGHISDLHAQPGLSAEIKGRERVVGALLDDLAARHAERLIDLLVFSGDLSYDGSEEALARGRELLLDPLRERIPDVPIVLAPGNHDVARGLIDEALDAGLALKLKSREQLAARLAGDGAGGQDRLRLKPWDAFQQSWDAGIPGEQIGPGAFAYELQLDGRRVALGSFDTAWRSSDSEHDRGRLLLGVELLRDFLEAKKDCDLTLVTFHHPPEWLAEFESGDVRVALEQYGAAALTGHDHVADPSLTVAPRGRSLHCRAPCSYSGAEYSNGYALIDVDIDSSRTAVTLRRWSPRNECFLADLDSAPEGGTFNLNWPSTEAPGEVVRLPEREVVQPLVALAKEHSVLPESAEVSEPVSISDFAVLPRFWPVPHSEAFNRSVEREHRPEAIDPLDELGAARALILCGPRMSGVTTALLLTLERHYRAFATHVPAYVLTDRRFSRRKIQDAIDAAHTRAKSDQAKVLLAVDDADPIDSRALGRLVRILRDNPEVTLILGCHGEAYKVLGETLDQHVAARRAHLGPFGRRQTRELVARISGSEGTELVGRILSVVQRQQLPRNPLNLAALVSVLSREPDLTAINESGLLDSYVNLLLDNPIPGVDLEGMNMDRRRREHLLLRIAEHVVTVERTRIPRAEIEELVLGYYRDIGWRSASAGRLLDSLIRRRVLAEDSRGVGFRYPALLHLFAAKAVIENPEFASRIERDPITYSQIIRHLAGLRRDDRATLELALGVAIETRERIAAEVSLEDFDRISDEDGWSQIESLDHVRRLLDSRPKPPTQEELDDIYEEVAEDVDEEIELRPFEEDVGQDGLGELMGSYLLLCSVLQSSELIPDVEFRAEALGEAVTGWGLIALLLSVEEDLNRNFQAAFEPFFSSVADEDEEERAKRISMVEHLARVFVLSMMATGLYIEVGTVHQEKVLQSLLDNEEFMAGSARALFAGLLYAMLQFSEWPKRLEALFLRHADHPMVRELLRRWCLHRYYAPDLPEAEAAGLEALLEKILGYHLGGGIGARVSHSNQIREHLRKTRRDTLFSERDGGAEADEDAA